MIQLIWILHDPINVFKAFANFLKAIISNGGFLIAFASCKDNYLIEEFKESLVMYKYFLRFYINLNE